MTTKDGSKLKLIPDTRSRVKRTGGKRRSTGEKKWSECLRGDKVMQKG